MIVLITETGMEVEQGCGECVDRLTDSLRELGLVIGNSSSLLASVNATQEDLLTDGIMESQVMPFVHSTVLCRKVFSSLEGHCRTLSFIGRSPSYH